MAASLTEAIALNHLAVRGDEVARIDDHEVAGAEVERGHAVEDAAVPGARRFFAVMSLRVALRLAAWALPRPSAIASAKFAKRSVNQSQRMIWKLKPRFRRRSRGRAGRGGW